MKWLTQTLADIRQYPSAIMGLLIIVALIGVALYAVIAIPYDEAIRLWRGGEEVWGETPRTVPPTWINLFRRQKLPQTIVLNVDDDSVTKERTAISEEMYDVVLEYTFDYDYDAFPQSLKLVFTTEFESRSPHVSMTWIKPDGEEVRLGELTARREDVYRLDQDDRLTRRLGGITPSIGLFADLEQEESEFVPVKGTYTLLIEAITFEEDSDVDAKFVLNGRVYGMAGTDHRRRDLGIALLWGTPIALSFGLLAALGTTITTMIIAAVGVWYGGVVDSVIQRITEINMLLPFLPILIMVGTFIDRSIWVLLFWVILLSIFGGAIKNYRATFLQIKESDYIEAAQAYGAGNGRIIVFYLVPRIIPVLIPQLVSSIPTYVFLEASLALLGLGDPTLPTWGKVIEDARSNGALYNGQYYWILQPAALLMITGLAFAMVGFAMDRIFNPRLREV
ncbi:MAG: ABC transporter permease [Anaerolineales bacterium]